MKPSIFVLAAMLFLGSVDSLRAEEIKLSHGGLILNASLVEASDKGLTDGVVLITHGLLAHNGMEIVATLQELLAERGLNSLAINLSLGLNDRHGMYDCATPHTHKLIDGLDEIGAWVAWLDAKGAGGIVLAGHSNGGRQTAWFAAEHDHPAVEKVVLIAPAISAPDADARSYKERYGKDLAPLVAKARALVAAGQGGAIMARTDFLYCPAATVSAASFVSYYGDDPRKNTTLNLPAIEKPVLVVAGTADRIVTGLGPLVQPLADGEKLTYVEIEDAGHFFLDFFGEDLADAIAAFLAGPKS
ncbi:MAG: alpha/beta hydrolase [Alphaproteobacteria bacterium]